MIPLLILLLLVLGLVTAVFIVSLLVAWVVTLTPYGKRRAEEEARRDFMRVMWWR